MMKKIVLFVLFGGLLMGCNQNPSTSPNTEATNIQQASMLPTTPLATSDTQEVWLESLITKTPQEGRELAIKMARKTIGAIQKDGEVKKRLRGQYAEDPELLILSAQVVAIEFQTVAEANNYWRN